MTKEEIIDLIDEKIKSEYSKHGNLDWSKIASQKIYENLIELNLLSYPRFITREMAIDAGDISLEGTLIM